MKISIITPAYNSEKYIMDCAESILKQTHTNFEWIIVDDGSTDNTASLLETLTKQDKRIKVFNQKNQGAATARNTGLEQRTGEFFAFVDADDMIHPLFLELSLKAINKDQADFISFNYREVADNCSYKQLSNTHQLLNNYTFYKNSWAHYMSASKSAELTIWNKLYRTAVFKNLRFNTEIRLAEDLLFGWHVRVLSKTLVHLHNELYYYRSSETSISRKGITKELLTCINIYFNQVYNEIALNKSLTPLEQRFVQDSLNNHIFKTYYKEAKSKNISKELDDLAKEDLQKLQESGVFTPSSLPLKRRIRTWLR